MKRKDAMAAIKRKLHLDKKRQFADHDEQRRFAYELACKQTALESQLTK